jgi:hypothetical protein
MTRRALFAAVAGALFLPAYSRWKRSREQRELDNLFAYGQARFRSRLQAEGLDPDRMTEEEVEDYVERVIHEYRQEQREKQRAG